ncbi:TonB-dependent receptor [Salinisphaera dokdonensis CL-ES53]|uniref:TonB-dependent receptor n=1 Tax=Salinisphaera dokdonensis CL-ES53 TaxID=1304272 RepID=A0ABV2B0S4_9GAMM
MAISSTSIAFAAQAQDSLEPLTEADLGPITVSATRNKTEKDKSPRRVTVIQRQQIEQQLASTSDPGQVLANLIPSYSPSRQKLSNAGETLRGRDPQYLVDGVPQTNPLRDSSRDSYTVDLSMVERIEVIYGASAEHGLGATGGIINFVTRRPEGGTLSQHAGISLTTDDDGQSDGLGYKADYRVSGAKGKWDYLVAASWQERGVFYDGNDEAVGVAYPGEIQNSTSYDLLGKLGYWIDDNQEIQLSLNHFDLEGNGDYVPVVGDRANGVETGAEKGDPIGDPGYNNITTARISYSHADWHGNELDAQIYTQRFRAQFDTTPFFPYTEDGQPAFDQTRNESDKIGSQFTFNRQGMFDGLVDIATGVDLLQDETQQVLVHTGRTYVPETRFRSYAGFLQTDLHLTEALTVTGGVRRENAKLKVDDYATIDRSNVTDDAVDVGGGEPSFSETLYNAGLTYQATAWGQLYASYSEGFGMPDVGRVLRGISTPGQDVDDLLELTPIVTDTREVGTRLDWGRYGLEVSYYQSDSDLGQRLTERDGRFVGSREKTEIHGLEVTGRAEVGERHRFDLSYAQAEGRSDTNGNGRVDTKLTGINIAPDTVTASWGATWSPDFSSYIQAVHYIDRETEDPQLDFDGFTLVNASLSHALPVGRAQFGIDNVFDKDYFTYYSQSARISDEYYFKGRGRTLKLGYQVDF